MPEHPRRVAAVIVQSDEKKLRAQRPGVHARSFVAMRGLTRIAGLRGSDHDLKLDRFVGSARSSLVVRSTEFALGRLKLV
jgi:hypothetical protein